MYLKGYTQQAIADHLGMTRQMVGYDLKAIRQEWLQSAIRNFDEARAIELARIDLLERNYWDQWEKSCERVTEQVKVAEANPITGKPEPTRVTIHESAGLGDVKYLEGVKWCIDRRCKLLGLDAPVKIAPTTPDGKEKYTSGATISTEEGLRRLQELIAAVKADGVPENSGRDGVPVQELAERGESDVELGLAAPGRDTG